MEEPHSLSQFYDLKLDLHQAVEETSKLAEDNFGKTALLKKDYLNLLDLMRETVTTARLTVGFLRLIFKVDTRDMSDEQQHQIKDATSTGKLFAWF